MEKLKTHHSNTKAVAGYQKQKYMVYNNSLRLTSYLKILFNIILFLYTVFS